VTLAVSPGTEFSNGTGCGTCKTCGDGCVDCPACDSGDCDTCLPPVIKPRTALLLHIAAVVLSDEVSGGMGDLEIFDFPPYTWRLVPAALGQFRTAFLALAADLAHGFEPHRGTNAARPYPPEPVCV